MTLDTILPTSDGILQRTKKVSKVSLPTELVIVDIEHEKGDGDGQALVQEVVEQAQAELEQTEVATLSAVNHTIPAFEVRERAKKDDPQVRQGGGNQQSHQASRLVQMAFVQVKATAFVVAK